MQLDELRKQGGVDRHDDRPKRRGNGPCERVVPEQLEREDLEQDNLIHLRKHYSHDRTARDIRRVSPNTRQETAPETRSSMETRQTAPEEEHHDAHLRAAHSRLP